MKNFYKYLIILLTIISFGLIIFSFSMDKNEISEINFSEEWIKEEHKNMISYKNLLPANLNTNYFLSFLTDYQKIEIYLNNQLLYTNNISNYFHNIATNELVRIPISEKDINQEIKINIVKMDHKKNNLLPKLNIVKINDFMIYHSWHFFIPIIFTVIFVLIGFIFTLYGIKNKKDMSNKHSYIYLGLFTLLAGFLIFITNPYLTSFIGKPIFIANFNYLCMMALTLLFLFFLRSYLKIFSKSFIYLLHFNLIVYFGILLIHLFGIRNFSEMIFIIYILILISGCYGLTMFYKNMKLKRTKDSKIIFSGYLIFAICIIFTLWSRIFGSNLEYSIIFFTGLIIFLTAIIVILSIESLKEINVTLLTKYAFFDELTGIKNRTAYENDIKTILGPIILIVFDVNYLKTVNDEFGHLAGDELLKNCVLCLQHALSNYCFDLYRIGGDEFVAIIKGEINDVLEIETNINSSMEKFNKNKKLNISISFGIESFKLTKPNYEIFESHFQIADQKMYKNKIDFHNQRK